MNNRTGQNKMHWKFFRTSRIWKHALSLVFNLISNTQLKRRVVYLMRIINIETCFRWNGTRREMCIVFGECMAIIRVCTNCMCKARFCVGPCSWQQSQGTQSIMLQHCWNVTPFVPSLWGYRKLVHVFTCTSLCILCYKDQTANRAHTYIYIGFGEFKLNLSKKIHN